MVCMHLKAHLLRYVSAESILFLESSCITIHNFLGFSHHPVGFGLEL